LGFSHLILLYLSKITAMKNILNIVFFSLLSTFGFGQLLEANFETGVPPDWEAENAWKSGKANLQSSSSFIIPEHSTFMAVNDDQPGANANTSGKLISPTLDFTDVEDSYAITFEAYFLNNDFQGSDETAKLMSSTDGGATWLEMFDVKPSFDWQTINVGIGDLAGKDNVLIAFDYDDGGGWNYGFAVDDVRMRTILSRDVALTDYSVPRYVPNQGDVPITLTIDNRGIEIISKYSVTVIHDGTEYEVEVTTPPLNYEENFTSQILLPFDISSADQYEFELNISKVNDKLDLDDTNNNGSLLISSVANPPSKRMVAEEATGTWCGWCLESMRDKYPAEFIGIAVHNGDPMRVAEYDDGLTSTPGFTGFPGMVINRESVTDPSNTEDFLIEEAKNISPIGVWFNYDYNEISRLIKLEAHATIHTKLTGDYRFALVITEDFVMGTDASYNQANYYSGSLDLIDIHGVNYRNLPDPIPFNEIFYHEVARTIIGGYEGLPGSIGSDLTDGMEIVTDIDYVLPAEFNEDNINMVLLVIDAESGAILNGRLQGLNKPPVSVDNLALNPISQIYPNPSSGDKTIVLELNKSTNLNIELLDLQGSRVYQKDYANMSGQSEVELPRGNLAAGTYLTKLTTNEGSFSFKVIFVD